MLQRRFFLLENQWKSDGNNSGLQEGQGKNIPVLSTREFHNGASSMWLGKMMQQLYSFWQPTQSSSTVSAPWKRPALVVAVLWVKSTKWSCACLRRRFHHLSSFCHLELWFYRKPGMLPCYGFFLTRDLQLTVDFHEFQHFLSMKNKLQIAFHALPVFSSMVATVPLTLRRLFCLHYRKSLPPGSRNNVLTYNRFTDFCEHHFHGNKLGNLSFWPPSWHQMGQLVKIRCKLHRRQIVSWVASELGHTNWKTWVITTWPQHSVKTEGSNVNFYKTKSPNWGHYWL